MERYSVAHSKHKVRPQNGTLSVGLDVGVGEGVRSGWIGLSHGMKLMRIPPRTGFTWPETQKVYRIKTLGVSLRWRFNAFWFPRLEWAVSLHTHQEQICPALWSSSNPSRFNTDAHSSHCLPVTVYCTLWVLVKLLCTFASIKIMFSSLVFLSEA